MYKHLGYYNGEDVIELCNATKDEIIDCMLLGYGVFHVINDMQHYLFDDIKNPIGSNEDSYIITVSIPCDDNVPIEDCFIDVYLNIQDNA